MVETKTNKRKINKFNNTRSRMQKQLLKDIFIFIFIVKMIFAFF